MSVFGGDSWAREAHHRKRRLDDLLLSSTSSSSTGASFYKRLSNGKFACLVCPHKPVLDSPLILSMHIKGSRHIAAETKLKEKELSIKEEINKRISLSGDINDISSSICPSSKLKGSAVQNKPQNKPLIEKTRQVLLETHCDRIHGYNPNDGCNPATANALTLLSDNASQQIQRTSSVMPFNHNENSSEKITAVDSKMISDKNAELLKRRAKELQFTAAGWKRDGQGKWYKDENVEFDSDEEDPNVFFS
ncbi:hypothetical protein IEQ34_019290 [Dendrobium chrysotoxum]|uniref:Sodium channel modifier 1 n=1 Tax=Dendrobium chrysotoxum TaxID=161865 RepID=A0AAV7G6P1_DENCH|nr:hypothetical protein IEQ34_019290 [Dendrobium chrysotoxum]